MGGLHLHLVIAGASGATGRLLIDNAVAAGHTITALVRPGSTFDAPNGVRMLEAQVTTDRELTLPDSTDAVISTLGKRSYDDTDPVCTAGTENLLAAMQRQGIHRIVTVSASPVLRSGAGEPWWFRRTVRPMVRRKGPNIYADLEAMEEVLRSASSFCDWTILRPGYLVDKPARGHRLVPQANSIASVHRADLAGALLEVVQNPDTCRRAYGVAPHSSKERA
ncbi:NAD(P)-dependent oxidoreductase [Rhodococcus artemisiae]|uniref:SDR family oxidoreductase n=1 Tax=Rhodococcus artemisiae TaxID=714159 RepID=A0ABU7L6H9_9NOCA|nr:NAD(P)-binding oxidoreductase [Rhodococcus artemisiae]MEE2057151.1 SDR family oxidoreductase [Rhodococcus artemisiae]